VSFDEESQKPLFVNEAAVLECMKMLKGRDAENDFIADDKFVAYYEKETNKKNPSQKDINNFIRKLTIQCATYKPESNEISEFYLDGDKIRKHADS